MLQQLHEDVFGPAKTQGYRRVWMAGISLGGFGALLYASRYPDDLSGVLAMAPFLGQHELIEEIMSAGGLAHWIAGEDDHPRHLWRWFKTYEEKPSRLPKLFLAYGEGDLFAPAPSDCSPPRFRLLAFSPYRETIGGRRGGNCGTAFSMNRHCSLTCTLINNHGPP